MGDPLAHSELGPSIAHRWTECTASVSASRGLPNNTNEAAEEGTAAHNLLARCLVEDLDAVFYLGETVESAPGWKFVVDEDTAAAVQVCIDYVRGRLAELPGATLKVEYRFDLQRIAAGMFGTADIAIICPGVLVEVIDYKHGRRHVVEVIDNPQAKLYGVGALHELEASGQEHTGRVVLTICQPRANHADGRTRSWDVPGGASALLRWAEEAVKPAAAEALGPSPKFKAGPHCEYCLAAARCPAIRDASLARAMVTFQPVGQPTAPPDPKTMTPAQITALLSHADMIETWVGAVRDFAFEQARAGNAPAGWKLVETEGKRKWADETALLKVLLDKGIPSAILHKSTLHSPAQIEKAVKGLLKDEEGKPMKTKEISQFITAHTVRTSGSTLAPESDSRPALPPAFTPIAPAIV